MPDLDPEKLELLEKYLNGQLPPGQLAALERDLAEDEELRKLVEELKMAILLTKKYNIRQQIKSSLDEFRAGEAQNENE